MKSTLMILCFAAVVHADSRCNSMSGTCQDDSLPCSDGHYRTGLCDGDVNRCCVPNRYCGNVQLITRDQWEARNPVDREIMRTPVELTFIHHTAFDRCYNIDECCVAMRVVQDFHMDVRGWWDIGYSFLIGDDGNAYEGRGWGVVGAHTQGYNDIAHAASFMGDFTNVLPSKAALDAVYDLIQCGIVDNDYITSDYCLLGHRDVNPNTTCPGDTLYNEIRTWEAYGRGPGCPLFSNSVK